jgi:LPS O-antigen subunit length determinant protein (WzzB/FepE family)
MQAQTDNNFNPSSDTEISLLDILRFLKDTYKTIVITGILGLAAAIAYLTVTPKQYEAIAQIAMAQIGAVNNNNNNNNNNLNPLGINIEEPSLLIARLTQPTNFTSQVIDACKVDKVSNPGATLAKSINLELPKGTANVVELKTFGKSPQDAQLCAEAIFELIKTTQAQIVAPYIEEAKIKLLDNQERLAKAKELIAKADKSGSAMGAAYLSTRDEIRFLLDEITALKNLMTSNQNRVTRLIAPIYANDVPIAPKKRVVLAGGLLGGLFLGLLVAMVRQVIAKLKKDLGEAA